MSAAPAPSRAGPYVPPHLRRAQAPPADAASGDAQRLSWEQLRKALNGVANKVNASNLALVLPELFAENLVRGRGLFCRALLKAQQASPAFTPVYAALIAVVNTKLPEVGELMAKRVVVAFRRAFRRANKPAAVALARLVAHLVNTQVLHELAALQLLSLLLERPTDDSVEVAVGFCKESGQLLQELSPAGLNAAFERFRGVLHEGQLDQRVAFLVEGLFAVRKARFADFPSVPPELDLVESDDQITHEVGLDDEGLDPEDLLDVFALDADYAAHEAAWAEIRAELLGGGATGGEGGSGGEGGIARGGDGAGADASSSAGVAVMGGGGDDDEHGEGAQVLNEAEATVSAAGASFALAMSSSGGGAESNGGAGGAGACAGSSIGFGQGRSGDEIVDLSETDLVNLRRTIYLTIMSSVDFEECAHKLMKLAIPKGAEGELCNMLVECCSQERTFLRYYGLLAQRFCMISRAYQDRFEESFGENYATIHRLDTNKLRNVAKFFAHLLHTDALPWTVLECVRLNEDETTSSSRIFIKILCQELAEYMGLRKLRDRLLDPYRAEPFAGLLPRDSLRNTRFSINFFTSSGLGALTDGMREQLAQEQQRALAAAAGEGIEGS